jgi:tetratricopeptide (TPR) repeat protein
MMEENWYSATEALLETLRINNAHAEASAALAETYYALSEFDQALVWVRRARSLSRGNLTLANLEAFTLIALGRLNEATEVINEVLAREPYNREALFAASELDIARGRAGDAVRRYREAVRRYPDDRRLLISLALVLGSLGETENARHYIERAIMEHPQDFRVYYFASYLASKEGNINTAIRYAENAINLRPGYLPAFTLLANLKYRAGNFAESARLADVAIAMIRNDVGSSYLRGMSLLRMGRKAEAITTFTNASSIDPNNEFVRTALTDILIHDTPLEDPRRTRWANWHFARAQEFRTRNLIEQSLFEYRRGLRINPYAENRRDYAELLRIQGYPARYLEELRFMQDLGFNDRDLSDAVETFSALLHEALFRRWDVNPVEILKRHWKIAIFSTSSQSSYHHADAGAVASLLIKDILAHDRNIATMNLELSQPSFSQAFRQAREADADYFLIVSVSENERDISIKGELFVGRTGSPAGTFRTYRTGTDRLRNAARGIADQLSASLPFRGELLQYRRGLGLLDKGRADGVVLDGVYEIVKRGQAMILNEGIGLAYSQDDIVGTLHIEYADEEVASGTVTRNGFFDRISPGDEIILQNRQPAPPPSEPLADPELRALLRTLR